MKTSPPPSLETSVAEFSSAIASSLDAMTLTTVQRCGGHITLLFTVDKSSAMKRSQGSRGVGFSIHHGVEASGTLHRIERDDSGMMHGIKPDTPLAEPETKPSRVSVRSMQGTHLENVALYLDFIQACREATLLRPHEWLEVDVQLECPTSQGFGMSAAGLIALGKTIHALTGRGRLLQYLKIAHRIERNHGAGLGDVLGASVGGVELRLAPGAPGWPGKAVSFGADAPVLLIWNPHEERHTSTYIDDPHWQASITAAGDECVDVLASKPWERERWPEVLTQSRMFASASGMLEEEERARLYKTTLEAVQNVGAQASLAVRLCMLGSSVVVVPRRLDAPVNLDELNEVAAMVEQHGFAHFSTALAPVSPQM